MGFIVPSEGGSIRYEVIVIFEERESRREGDQGEVLEEKFSTAGKNTSRIVLVGSGQASKQGDPAGRRKVDGKMLRIASAFARFVPDESSAGQQQRERQHRRSDEYEEIRRVQLERTKRDSDCESRPVEHSNGEAELADRKERGGRSRGRAAGRIPDLWKTLDLCSENSETQQTHQEAEANDGSQS